MLNHKGFTPVLLLVIVALILALGVGGYFYYVQTYCVYYGPQGSITASIWAQSRDPLNLCNLRGSVETTTHSNTTLPLPSGLLPMQTQSHELTPEEQNKIPALTPQPSTTFSTEDITESGNGKIFIYPVDDRFAIDLDPQKHPFKNLVIPSSCPIAYVSNNSGGPDSYPYGFQTMSPGSCMIKNGDFSAILKVQSNPN